MKKKNVTMLVPALMISTLAAGCSSNGASQTASSPASTSQASASNQTVTIKFWDRHPELQPILTKEINDFQQKNPNIKVELTEVPVTTQNQQYQAAVASNSLPDVFALSGYSLSDLVKMGQLHSMNDFITADDQKNYPAGVFTQGYSMIGDQVYMLPLYAPYHITEFMYYNKDILQKYGLSVPKTWDDLMNESKEIYQKSNGKTYGIAMSFKQSEGQLEEMATAIKPDVAGGFNYKTGRYEWNNDGYVQTLDFFKNMFANHLINPDSVSMSKAQARGALAAGQAAFEFDGDWGGGLYLGLKFNNFGVTALPTKDGNPYYLSYVGPTGEGISINAKTKYYDQAKLFVQYLENNVYDDMVNAGLDTAKQVKPQNPQFPQIPDIMDILQKTSVATPNFFARNDATMGVMDNFNSNKPKTLVQDILAGYLSGQIKSVPDALKQLDDQYNQVLDKAINASNGKVVQKDFIFSNWTPLKPYTQADYANSK